jgi:hypothetical protein
MVSTISRRARHVGHRSSLGDRDTSKDSESYDKEQRNRKGEVSGKSFFFFFKTDDGKTAKEASSCLVSISYFREKRQLFWAVQAFIGKSHPYRTCPFT